MSVRAGLANIQRGDVGVRQAQQPTQPPGATQAEIERYNTILQSEEFQSASPIRQAATVASWNLSAEQRAPLMASIKASMQSQRQVKQYNRFLQSEQFASMKPETQVAMVQSWALTPEQRAPVIEAIRTRVQSQKDLAVQVEAQVASAKAIGPGAAAPKFTDPLSKGLFANIAGAQEMRRNPAGYALKKGTEIAGAAALLVAPAVAVPGALFGTGISQGFKSVGGGGLLTGEETKQAFLGGAAFSAVGAGTVKALGLTGAGVRSAAGRVAVSTGLGAAAGTVGEYAVTGKVTGEGTLQGAAFGAAFGLLGEGARYGLPKVAHYVRGRTQAAIDASYDRQIRYNEAVLSGKVKGVTEVWSPTWSQKAAMRLTRVAPSTRFAQQVNVARVPSGNVPFNMAAFQRVGAADELFDFGFVPKSAMATENIPAPMQTTTPSRFALHPVMFSWKEFKGDLKGDLATAELNAELKQRAIDRGIPESQLAYDYRGELGFEKSPLKMEYAQGKTVRYAWEGPYQQAPSTRAGMRPLWESIGAKTPKSTTFTQALIEAKPTAKTGISSATSTAGMPPYSATSETLLRSVYSPSMWQGTPYPGARSSLAMEETLFLSYPASGLAHPMKLGEALSFGAIAGLLPKQLSRVGARQDLAAMQTPLQIQTPLLDMPTITETTTTTTLTPDYPTSPKTSTIRVPSGFKFEGPGFDVAPFIRRQRTRGRKRTYPILTGKEVLKLKW